MKTIMSVLHAFYRALTGHKVITTILVGAIVLGGGYYYYRSHRPTTTSTQSFYAITPVAYGAVSSGIETTGTINAEQELDLNIYKQLKRITAVNVVNGQHVTKNDVLVAFDKSDANVTANTSKAALTSAELALQNAKANAQDPNTQILTLQSQIASQRQAIVQNTQNIADAHRTFLNANREVVADPARKSTQDFVTTPTLSGTYTGTAEGQYGITVYSSNTQSGLSFSYSGIENGANAIVFNTPMKLGTDGLMITFGKDTRVGDKWIVKLPNTDSASYGIAKQAYDTAVANAQTAIANASSTIASDELQIKKLQQTDTNSYRDLNVTQAQNAVQQAQQNLTQAYTTINDRNIVAPFSGTVEGMQNVVVGATPVGGTSDTINLGTLISDKFITSFTLSAADVGKVSVGQAVKVTVTSLTNEPTFDATITEISSLPASSGVAQYTVKALLNYDRTTDSIVLRDGMMANIEVVQKNNPNAMRIPASAVTYKNGQPTVDVVNATTLTAQQKQEVSRGIIRTTTPLQTYPVTVTLGIQGSYWYEVTNGLKAGDLIVTSQLSNTPSASSVVRAGFGGGAGQAGVRPSNESTGSTRPNGG